MSTSNYPFFMIKRKAVVSQEPLPFKFWSALSLFTGALFIYLIIMPLMRQGMFLDGVTYAAIAKNLSLNHGSTWQPFYSATLFPVFYEHPPLAIYFESIFFRIFGDHSYVERGYCFTVILIQFAMIAGYWLRKEKLGWHHLWLLLLIWLLVPLNPRVLTSNMLESTLTLFTTAATLLILSVYGHKWVDLKVLFCASMAILLGFLSNGPTAFFPLMVPLIQFFISAKYTNFWSCFQRILILIGMISLCFVVFYFSVPAAWQNTKQYMLIQVLPSVLGGRPGNFNNIHHLHILFMYIRAIGPVSIFSIMTILIAARLQDCNPVNEIQKALRNRNFLLFLYVSMLASFPVGISHRQAFSYITPCAPFITLASIYLCHQPCLVIMNFCRKSLVLTRIGLGLSLAFLIAVIGLAVPSCSNFNRDQALLTDIRILIPKLKQTAVVSASKTVFEQWISAAYFARFSMIGLEQSEQQTYYLALKNEPLPATYKPVRLGLHYYSLGIRDDPRD